MPKCFRLGGAEYPDQVTNRTVCANNTVDFSRNNFNGGTFVLVIDGNVTKRSFSSTEKTEVDPSLCVDCGTPPPLTPNQAYDCINGKCIPRTTYNTPGLYGSLPACESGCAKNSDCTGECINPLEIEALRQAANCLQTKHCG